MERIIVFYGLTGTNGENHVHGVVRITNNKLLQAVKSDAAKGLGFDELMFKHKLKQLAGEEIEITGGL